MPAFAPGAVFLGSSVPLAGAASDTPVVIFGAGYGRLIIYHYIAGYSGGGGIALMQFGTGTTVDTGSNYSSFSNHFTTSATSGTSNASAAGIRVANDSTTNGRRGFHDVVNPTGAVKLIDSRTVTYTSQTPTAASAAMASNSLVVGTWFQNSQAQCVSMGAAGVTMLAGTFISVYGIPGTG